jgi:hypothetical protein
MSPQSFEAALGAIRQSGSVFGVILAQGNGVIYEDTTIPASRVAGLVALLDDIANYFRQDGRRPDQLSFGYDGGNVFLQMQGEFRLVILHHQVAEVDAVANTCAALLKDYAMNVLVEAWVAGQSALA